ncbi:MAG TPA: protein-methionine-sulfoxide reductase catalytic subunit MsrP [Methylomirabilota bacterium]|jgi:sulfoxide reductase catalytic subunit YedY|nr:protein-methionine-sulfoxide reductase catalytic subunit MsrP [Methylomirabilota bacterium]
MLIKRSSDLNYSDVTPKSVYVNRRKFLAQAAIGGGALLAGKALWELLAPSTRVAAATQLNPAIKSPFSTTEPQTSYNDVTHYNNFYEFGTDKSDPARNATNFRTSPWSVKVDGEVVKPRKFSMDEILQLAPLEERIYRHRCVEGWSIVVPWIGYSFSVLANLVQPKPTANFVAFQSYYDIGQMPMGQSAGIQLPYVEGLRLDEAMNPLALLCVGMYGGTLPNQDGAPVRMVLPWKYGFKSIKSLVHVKFVKDMPQTTWNLENPHEYGFYSNVNPNVDHPRWSQAKERRLGEFFKRPTLMFNGYSDQVASMYAGMDLRKYF